jgi:putative oxidoreductase
MLRKLIQTGDDAVALLLRLTLGVVMLPHGAQKVLGWFGGAGFGGTMQFFTQRLHTPTLFALLAIVSEAAGALGLLSGFLTRIAAFGILCNMIVAVAVVHLGNGFFMNWFGHQKGEGFEYHLLAIGLALAIIIRGGGMASVDRALSGAE